MSSVADSSLVKPMKAATAPATPSASTTLTNKINRALIVILLNI
jgi:hypothetical protein